MEKIIIAMAGGCFAGTVAGILIFVRGYTSPLVPMLLPMWGAIIGLSIGNVMNRPNNSEHHTKAAA